VLIEVHPHWSVLAAPVLAVVVAAGGGLAALVATNPGPFGSLAAAAVVIVALGWLGIRVLRRERTVLLVTTQRIVSRAGLVAREAREIPMGAVTEVGFSQGVVERLIGRGRLRVEVAGSAGGVVFGGLPRPELVHQAVTVALARRFAGPGARPDAGPS
jgi:uncharacterized membrane protein YdbT with pleckstrin-like domain